MSKLGIIAGGGELPHKIIESCLQKERPFFVLALEGNAKPDDFQNHRHHYVHLGQVSYSIDLLKQNQVTQVVMAGHVKRPAFSKLKLDAQGFALAAKITKAKLFGDDSVLSAIIAFLEQHQLKVIGVEQILDNILATDGVLGKVQPSQEDMKDIELACKAANLLGQLDIGQAVIVQNLHILGVEAAEGTDALIARCADLACKTKGGVLVKLKKPTQDTRVDLPTIGINTIANLHKAGLHGVAIEAKGSLIINYEEVIKLANQLGVFITGINKVNER